MLRKALLLATAWIAPILVFAGDRPAAQNLLDLAAGQARLLEDSAHPFVMDVDFTAQVNAPVQGHLRLRWESKERWWSKVSLRGFEQVKFQVGERTWTVRNANFTPTQIRDLFNLLHVATRYDKLVARKEKQRVEHGVHFDCIEAQPLESKSEHREICLDPTTHDILSEARDFGYGEAQRAEYGDFTDFDGHRYPRRLKFQKDGKEVVSATLTGLEEEPLDAKLLVPPAGAFERRECANEIPPHPLTTPQANTGQEPGESEYELTILTDGSVGEVQIVGKSGRIDDGAVMAALRKTRFKPAMCGADPVIAEIVVSFRTGSPGQ